MFIGEVPEELIEDVSDDAGAYDGFGGWDGGGTSWGRSAGSYGTGGFDGGGGRRAEGPVAFGASGLRTPGSSAGAGSGSAAFGVGTTGGAGSRATIDAATLKSGDRVRHAVFGEGTVVSCTPAGGDTVVTIAFPEQGVKKLLASVAPLEKI